MWSIDNIIAWITVIVSSEGVMAKWGVGVYQSKRFPTWINTCIFPDLNMCIYAPDILDCSTHTQDHYHPDCVSFLSNIPIYHNQTHLAARMTSEQHGESKHFHMGKVMKVQWGMQCSCALHQHSFPPRLDSAIVQEDEITVTRQWQWHTVDFVHKNCFAGFLFSMMTVWWGFVLHCRCRMRVSKAVFFTTNQGGEK